MITLAQLWLPILLSAVGIFIVSSLIHMVFKWHNSDYKGFSNEDAVRATMRAGNPPDGMYVIPYCKAHKELANPADAPAMMSVADSSASSVLPKVREAGTNASIVSIAMSQWSMARWQATRMSLAVVFG